MTAVAQALAGSRNREQQIMAVWVPDWPVTVAMDLAGLTAEVPAAVAEGRTILAASAMARAQGVRRGMRRRTAQEASPEVRILPRDYPAEIRGFEQVARAVEGVMAHLTVVRPGLLWARQPDSARRRAEFAGGAEAGLSALAGQVTDAVALMTGAECMIGSAGTAFAAVVAAHRGMLVPYRETAEFLRHQPVTVLRYMTGDGDGRETAALADLTALLVRLGLFTLGDLLGLTPDAVRTRFGDRGERAYRLAGGEADRMVDLWRPATELSVTQEIDPPALRSETVMFAAQPMAERLHRMLLDQSLTCARLQITATTTQGDLLTRCWQADEATWGGMTPRQIADRVRWQLDGWLSRAGSDSAPHRATGSQNADPDVAPVRHLQIDAVEVHPAPTQGEGLWGTHSSGAARAHRTADRLHGLLGADGVFTAVAQGGRTPRDQVRIVPWGQVPSPAKPHDRPWPHSLPGPAPTSIPVEPLAVQIWDQQGDTVVVTERLSMSGPPHHLQFPQGSVQQIARWAGPWPVVERWWASEGVRAVYLQVVTETGEGLLVSYSDGRWLCDGRYD